MEDAIESFETETKTGPRTITSYEFARWAALIEAVDIIAEKCEDRGIDFNSNAGMKYIKPLDIQDYVDNRTDTLLMKIKTARGIEKTLNNIKCLQIENKLRQLDINE
jgi:hypothetical protein